MTKLFFAVLALATFSTLLMGLIMPPYIAYHNWLVGKMLERCNECDQTRDGRWCYQWGYESYETEYGEIDEIERGLRCFGESFFLKTECQEECSYNAGNKISWLALALLPIPAILLWFCLWLQVTFRLFSRRKYKK